MKFLDFNYKKYNGEKIVIYGCERMAYITTYCLHKIGVEVNLYSNIGGSYVAPFHNIISIDELSKLYHREKIIVIFSVENKLRLNASMLEKRGIDIVYSVRLLWDKIDFTELTNNYLYKDIYDQSGQIFFYEDIINYPNKIYLYSLETMVTEKCSLKCKDCSNLMQYYCNPQDLNMDEIKRSIDILISKIDVLYELRILGGEPFINNKFVELIDKYLYESKIRKIVIYTNATIFPKTEVLEHLKNPKTSLRFSDYGKLSGKLSKWVEWCENNNIKYVLFKPDLWHDCGKLERKEYCEYELMDLYGNCDCRNLPTLIGNKLFCCPYAANASNLGAMRKNESEKDFVIIDDNINGKQIDSFLFDRKYLEACRYCNGRNINRAKIIPNIQTKEPLEYRKLLEENVKLSKGPEMTSLINKTSLLSVIIPVYNCEKTIKRCLDSVSNQTYNNIEVIIIDDGSEDRTIEICKNISLNDSRIHFFTREHKGVASARNTGIEMAKGDYITFLDGDDYIALNRYENMMLHIEDCEIISAGYMIEYDEDLSISEVSRGQGRFEKMDTFESVGTYEGEKLEAFIQSQFQYCIASRLKNQVLWTKIFKSDILKKVYCFVNKNISYGEDALLYYLSLLESKKIKLIKEYGYFYQRKYGEFNKYDSWKRFENIFETLKCFNKYFEKHNVQKKDLFDIIKEFYLAISMNVTGQVSKNLIIWYPYFKKFSAKRIILYGAGNVGKLYYKHIIEDSECILVAWVDNNAAEIKKSTMLPVEGIECLYSSQYDYIIVAVFTEDNYLNIKEKLLQDGVPGEKIIWSPTKYVYM